MLRTIFTFSKLIRTIRHLVGLACTAWTGVSREPDYDCHTITMTRFDSTLTHLLHYDALRYDIAESSIQHCTMTSGLTCRI